MRIIVSGGLGFIGSALIRHLINNTEHKVLNIDKETYAAMPEALAQVENDGNYMFEKIDITSNESLKKAFTMFKPDAVMHLAAESHVDRSIVGPAEFINTNILGTYNLLEASKDLWGTSAEGKKFLHVSTDEVFGSLNPNDQPFTEEHKYYPNSPYSASKASSDLLVRAWAMTYGLPAIVSNCSNNYGPWQFPEKFIPVVIFNAIQGNEIPVYGSGENIRDWLYVDDHVKALLKIVESDLGYTTFNIGANQEISNLKLAELICSILDSMNPRTDSKSYKEQISFVGDRLGHDFRYAINSDKLQEEMGFSIESDLEDGITKTIDWYLKNRNWLLSKQISES